MVIAVLAAILAAAPLPQADRQLSASDSVTLDAGNPNFNFYGRWRMGPKAVSITSGCLVEFAYGGDACTLLFGTDPSNCYPSIFVQVDNGAITRWNLSANLRGISLESSIGGPPKTGRENPAHSHDFHLVRFWIAVPELYRSQFAGTQWTALTGACRFLGVRLSGAGQLPPLPYGQSQIEFLGDSITQGVRLLYTGKEDDVGNQLPNANWPQLAADLLCMKPVVTGFGGQSLSHSATNGAPPAADAFPYLYSGCRWRPLVEPKIVVIYQGTNGDLTPKDFSDRYSIYLQTIREAYPTAEIFAICPHNRARYAGAIRDAVSGRRDGRIHFLDYSTDVISPNETSDRIGHLNPSGAVRLATRVAEDISAQGKRDIAERISAGRVVPARMIPVPEDVSTELQDSIRQAASRKQTQEPELPRTTEEWRAVIAKGARSIHDRMAAIKRAFPVTVRVGRTAGIATYTITPPVVPPRNKYRMFVCLHGGGYVSGAGEAGISEAILLAHYTQMKVVSIDYRMPPDYPFPAAVDDSVAVWRELIRAVKPQNIGIGGGSAGGGLTLAVVMKLRELKLPLPGAVYVGAPWADLTCGGDSLETNDYIDRLPRGVKKSLLAAGRLYAGTHDVRDPLISPAFGDFSHFPPTILLAGTRDLLLSDTVRVHRKLRAAGVEADLEIFEGMSHGDHETLFGSPESREFHHEITEFMDRHLGV